MALYKPQLRTLLLRQSVFTTTKCYIEGPGAGVGKGGGGGGSVREAGGAFGVMEAAREGEYFYKKNREQLLNMKKHIDEQIHFHEEAIRRHQKAITDSRQQAKEIEEHHRTHPKS